MSNGTVIQIIGAVIDVEFPKENLTKIYDALTVDETGLVLEVQGNEITVQFDDDIGVKYLDIEWAPIKFQ